MMPRSDFNQLFHLSELLEHYSLHKEIAEAEQSQMSVISFLYIHFVVGDDHTHDDHQGHNNLPFQSFSAAINYFLQPASIAYVSNDSVFVQQSFLKIYGFYKRDMFCDIFRPPSLV